MGVGLMGKPIAERLSVSGYTVTAWNRTAAKSRALSASGIAVAASPCEALSRSSHVMLLLSDASAIRDTLFSPAARAELAQRTIVQMGTIAPAESVQIADEIRLAGGDYFEAPVLGSIAEARAGRLLIMVGGTVQQFEENEDLFRPLCAHPVRVGGVGQAATVKLALNQLIASLTVGFSTSLGMVREAGLDVEQFMALLRESALYAPTFDKKLPRMLERDFARPNFPGKHLQKDVRLMLAHCAQAGIETDVLANIERVLNETVQGGFADADYSALYEIIHPPV